MKDQASITALMSAFGRAYHAEHEAHPVFRDDLAKALLSKKEYEAMQGYLLGGLSFFAPDRSFSGQEEALRWLVNTQIAPTPLCRAAYCEQALKTAVRTGSEQYVILGAGLDTFAFRNPEFTEKYRIFEVDHLLTQSDKKERIRRAGWKIPDHLCFVPVDFIRDSLSEKLLAAGFDPKKKTFFSWLGVSYYLDIDAIRSLLKELRVLCAMGSTLLFDYADAGLFLTEEKRVQNMIAMAKAGGEEMRSGFDYLSIDTLLADHGFLVYEILEPADIQRQIIDPAVPDMKAFEHIHYIQAVFRGI